MDPTQVAKFSMGSKMIGDPMVMTNSLLCKMDGHRTFVSFLMKNGGSLHSLLDGKPAKSSDQNHEFPM